MWASFQLFADIRPTTRSELAGLILEERLEGTYTIMQPACDASYMQGSPMMHIVQPKVVAMQRARLAGFAIWHL
jgi:hypothetical protein